MGKVRGTSSRGQKGGGCQLNSTQNAKPTFFHRKGCLDPGGIVRTKVNIFSYRADNRTEPLILILKIIYFYYYCTITSLLKSSCDKDSYRLMKGVSSSLNSDKQNGIVCCKFKFE